MPCDRLDRLPVIEVLGARVRLADSWRARLSGLALLEAIDEEELLLIPGCASIHTFGMRFAIDVVFLGVESEVLSLVEDVPPRRLASCRGAVAVIEGRAGTGDRLLRDASAATRRR